MVLYQCESQCGSRDDSEDSARQGCPPFHCAADSLCRKSCSIISLDNLMFIVKIEHALKEWENGKKAYKVAFSEDSAKQRFDSHYLLVFKIYLLIFISVTCITWGIGKECRRKLLHGSNTGKTI